MLGFHGCHAQGQIDVTALSPERQQIFVNFHTLFLEAGALHNIYMKREAQYPVSTDDGQATIATAN